jgi:hypothetical protein
MSTFRLFAQTKGRDMLRRSLLRSRIGAAVLILVAAVTGTTIAATSTTAAPKAPYLPPPREFVANLDLECFRTNLYQPPPLPGPLTLSHLNPVLADEARWEVTSLGARNQVCVPVAKNGRIPPKEVYDFVSNVDLSCYRVSGPSLNRELVLNHLNPVLEHLPRKLVNVFEPQQLCLPVIKNGVKPSDEVMRLVRFIDLVCYRETQPVPMDESLKLTQLNRVLEGLPTVEVRVRENRQLCVPVRKNNQDIPDEVLKIIQWIDLEKYDIVAPTMPTVTLKLDHINPLFANWPTEPATLFAPLQLAVPVAKNGQTAG